MSRHYRSLIQSNTFKLLVNTTTPGETFTLPLTSTGAYDFTVDWGDSSSSAITSYDDVNATHTYDIEGDYTISMSGTCTEFNFNDVGAKASKVNQVTDFVDLGFEVLNFANCINLTNISNRICLLSNITTAYCMFLNCNNLTSIPTGLFDNCSSVTDFNGTFFNCPITSIPTGLFDNCSSVTNFSFMFYGCTNLTSIPNGLFDNNTLATSFSSTFEGCTNLTSIPNGLFDNNTLATSFSNTFEGCNKAQFPIDLFYTAGNEGTRFLNKSVNFTNCFNRSIYNGIQGTAPDLWNCDFGTGTPIKTGCYSHVYLWSILTDGSTSSTTRIPGNTYKYQRTEYLITATEMAGFPGNTIDLIGFSIVTPGGTTQTGSFKIYLKNTTDVTYNLGITWSTTGFTMVSDVASWSIPITVGTYTIPFTGGSAFTYTGGGVYVAWEFTNTGTAGTTILSAYCNTSLAGGLMGYRGAIQSTKLASSPYRPATHFGSGDNLQFSNYADIPAEWK